MGSSPTKKAKVRARIALEARRKTIRAQARYATDQFRARFGPWQETNRVRRAYGIPEFHLPDELRRMAKDMGLEHLLPTTTGGGRREG